MAVATFGVTASLVAERVKRSYPAGFHANSHPTSTEIGRYITRAGGYITARLGDSKAAQVEAATTSGAYSLLQDLLMDGVVARLKGSNAWNDWLKELRMLSGSDIEGMLGDQYSEGADHGGIFSHLNQNELTDDARWDTDFDDIAPEFTVEDQS